MPTDYTDFRRAMTRGETHRFRFTVKDRATLVPQPVGDWPQFWVTAKVHLYDTDANAVFQLTLGNGVLAVSAATGLMSVKIDPSHTSSLDYRHYELFVDIQGQTVSGDVWTLARGILTVAPNVTRR